MRLSARRGDPGYRAWRSAADRGTYYDVELDGVLLLTSDCVMADEERGEVTRLVRDAHGNLVRLTRGARPVCSECGQFVPHSTGIARETLRGTVRLIERRRA
jgi:hypothetical protein